MNSKIKLLVLGLTAVSLAGCGMSNKYYPGGNTYYHPDPNFDYSSYQSAAAATTENPYTSPEEQKTNNISLTSSTFSYPCVREAIDHNSLSGAKSAIRTEEMLNYFSYGYVNETEKALSTTLELSQCPWNQQTYLASVVVKAKPAETANVKNNIVILIDRSGSMSSVFNLVKQSLQTLIAKLGNDDTVSIVSYASGTKVEADGLNGTKKSQLLDIVNGLTASGSTWGEGGIEKAYELAYKHFIEGGNNRVVLLTDGDFNVGKVSGSELTALIKQKASDGVYLTCCGYRSYNNGTLYTLSENGNGNAYYIDGELEATKVFEKEFGKAMFTVAKDTKCQIEFSDAVASYRLLGYETRQMSDQEFEDEKKDAGEIMSDHTTVALYELKLKEQYTEDYIFKSTLRYKDPITNESIEVINKKNDFNISRVADYQFASYVAEYCLTVTQSKYQGNSSYTHLLNRINDDYINDVYKEDFVATVRKTQNLAK